MNGRKRMMLMRYAKNLNTVPKNRHEKNIKAFSCRRTKYIIDPLTDKGD